MTGARAQAAFARQIGLRGVHAYLSANGWDRETPMGQAADLYRSRQAASEVAIVPASEDYGDYGTRIHQLAGQIAVVEGRARTAVLTDLSLADSDLVRLRLPRGSPDDTVSLTDGAAVLEESRNLLLAAACSAERPRRMYRAGRNKRAALYLRGVRLGHSERGSYVINLLSPVAPSLREDGLLLPKDPFERRVTRTLASGLRASRQVVDGVNRGSAGLKEFEDRVEQGISANLCRSVARLIEAGDGLEIGLSWALTRPAPDRGERFMVSFRSADIPVLREAGRTLSTRQERTDEEIEGYVARLSRDASHPTGVATIKAFLDSRLTSVQATFDPEDYSLITRAHDARLSVSLIGDLRREGERWHLRNPRDLAVIEEDDVD